MQATHLQVNNFIPIFSFLFYKVKYYVIVLQVIRQFCNDILSLLQYSKKKKRQTNGKISSVVVSTES